MADNGKHDCGFGREVVRDENVTAGGRSRRFSRRTPDDSGLSNHRTSPGILAMIRILTDEDPCGPVIREGKRWKVNC